MWRGKPRVNSSSLEPSLAFSSVQSLGRVRIFATPKIPDFRERQRDRRVWEPPVHSHLEFHGGGRGLSVLLKTVLPPSSDVLPAGQPRLCHCLHTAWSAFQTGRPLHDRTGSQPLLVPLPPPPCLSVLPITKMRRQHYRMMGKNLPMPT